MTKVCTKCGNEYENTLEFFRKKKGCIDNLSAQCKSCERERDRAYHKKKSKEPNGYIQQYRRFNGGYNLYISRVYNTYRLREQSLRDIMDLQKGCCAVCGKSLINPVYNKSDMHIDHCHTTGKIRGLLCCNCNHLIGVALENKEVLYNASKYLEDHS